MAYSGVYVFGDSLVDAGNALKLAEWYGGLPFSDLPDGAPTADQGYFQGRFTNGYGFADLIANKAIGTVTRPIFPYAFEDPWIGVRIAPFEGDPSGNNLNFAYGGAQIRQGSEAVPDLDGQTDAFKDAVDNHADPNALYVFTMGGNDVRNLAPGGSDPVPLADGYDALDQAAEKMLHEIEQLVDIGAHHILITGVPDVGIIPRYDSDGNGVLEGNELARSAAATQFSLYLDTLIRTEIVPALQAMGASVTYVPLMDHYDWAGNLVQGALSKVLPELAALHGLDADELSNNLLAHRDLIFFDSVHPNAQTHALVGAYSYSLLSGTPWIETLPLTGADVDYRSVASIGVAGEVDKLVVALVAGTTYTFEMLGMSSLGTAGSLADPSLRLLGPSGAIVGADADSGAGFDATLTFTAAASGNYTLETSATGSVTGMYATQAAVVSGAAMQSGNTYTINNALTVVLEGAGGIGQDVVKASVSYVLSAGSEIEVLQTTNDKGKTALNLTGNDFAQLIRGNAGANVIEGKGGADELWGGAGNDRFVLSNSAVTQRDGTEVDRIMDYGRGDIVDVTQILAVASSVNVLSGGYLRVTGSLIQVDVDGGGNDWVTLGTVNGTAAVTMRYLSGGLARDISVNRTTAVMAAAVAGAGLAAEPAAAAGPGFAEGHSVSALVSTFALNGHSAPPVPAIESLGEQPGLAVASLPRPETPDRSWTQLTGAHDEPALARDVPTVGLSVLHPEGTDTPALPEFAAQGIIIPPAAMLGIGESRSAGEVSRVLADALDGPAGGPIDALLPGMTEGPAIAHLAAPFDLPAGVFAAHPLMPFEAMAMPHDSPPLV